MKAVVCTEPYRLDLVERTAPDFHDGEVLVRIRRVGLCGTDYHIYAGRQPFLSYPRVIGHELGGEVEIRFEPSGVRCIVSAPFQAETTEEAAEAMSAAMSAHTGLTH